MERTFTSADRLLAVVGLAFLATTFLEWFHFSAVKFQHSHNGWQTGRVFGVLPALIVIALLVWLVLHRLAPSRLPDEIPGLYVVGGGMVALLPLLKLVLGDDQASWLVVERRPGLYLAVVAGTAVAIAGYRKFDELFRQTPTPSGKS